MGRSISKFAVLPLLFPSIALAHSGAADTTGFVHGLTHPLAGADHLLAMVAVGVWAAQLGGGARWTVPLAFVVAMLCGGGLALSGMALPFSEEGIVLSVLLLGVLIAAAVKPPRLYSNLLVGMFALFHGHAHGAEMLPTMEAIPYTLGFALTTALLHLLGVWLGSYGQNSTLPVVTRFTGGAIFASGVYLALA